MSFVAVVLAGARAGHAQQAAGAEADSLEEIVVTAERRSQDLQKVASSIAVVSGEDLAAQGKITTAQILEDIPNVNFSASRGADNPNGNISIRGVRSTQTTGGGPGPSATATYVDDVYQGIGGNYDVSRVEVLRGPQGTLYGRSATGGVVAFHTNDPVLGQTSTELRGEYGTAALRDAAVALNVPLSDTVAVRVAGHQNERHGYWSEVGGATSTLEGRVKLLYQPTSDLRVLLAASAGIQTGGSGGHAPTLVIGSPDTIDYDGVTTAASRGDAAHTKQFSATVNYDLGGSTLTYIGALHTYETHGTSGPTAFFSGVQSSVFSTPLDQFHTEEIRWASNSGGPLSWIVGASYYANIAKASNTAIQNVAYLTGPGNVVDTTDGVTDAPIFTSATASNTRDYGLFTEETWAVRDNLRLTGGVRFDKTRLDSFASYLFNVNLDEYISSLNPAINEFFPSRSLADFNNVTYKARVEYDLREQNMLYGMISTGFLPGDAQLSPVVHLNFSAPAGTNPFEGVTFTVLPFEQEKLTSFEVGSKNRFLDGKLQLNASAFYYDYQGYQEAVNAAPAGSPVPQFLVIAVPVRMLGAELDSAWAITGNDRLTLSGGWLDNKITSFPDIPGGLGNSRSYIAKDELNNIPKLTATLGYAHTFRFGDGSRLEARADARYNGAVEVSEITQGEVALGEDPYNHQSAYVIGNLGATWTSAQGGLGITGYVRNVGNEIYKSGVTLNSRSLSNIGVAPSDPRTYGIQINAKF
ncbi:MAG: TonB-dependent receptor [Steroidobacteraceae bacterium]